MFVVLSAVGGLASHEGPMLIQGCTFPDWTEGAVVCAMMLGGDEQLKCPSA